jgi:hypothetical protein
MSSHICEKLSVCTLIGFLHLFKLKLIKIFRKTLVFCILFLLRHMIVHSWTSIANHSESTFLLDGVLNSLWHIFFCCFLLANGCASSWLINPFREHTVVCIRIRAFGTNNSLFPYHLLWRWSIKVVLLVVTVWRDFYYLLIWFFIPINWWSWTRF